MKTLMLWVACLGLLFFLGLCSARSASAQTADFDIAPFGRRCCVEDRHVSQLTFDHAEAERAGSQAERAADGRYIYGLQWAEPRDIREVRVRFKPGSVAEKATVEYWYHDLALASSTPKCPTYLTIRGMILGRGSG